MLKFFKNKEKESTTAVISGCSWDAIEYIIKIIKSRHPESECLNFHCLATSPNMIEASMNNTSVGTVKCNEKDNYDEKTGEVEALNKAKKNHNRSFKKAIIRWQVAMLKDIVAVSPDTFDEALHKVRPCKCNCSNEK